MRQTINGLREQLILDTEISMISLPSKFKYNFRAPVSPPPNTYEINSDFSPSKYRGFGFGSSRQ